MSDVTFNQRVLSSVSAFSVMPIPNVTTVQMNTISTPSAGNTVFNTDYKCLFTYSGTEWQINETEFVIVKSTNYTASLHDRTIHVTGTTTITLPTTVVNGKRYSFKNTGAGTVTIDGNGANIDGSGTQSLSVSNQSITIVFYSGNWFIE